jgi:hypothetical protein
MDQLILVDHLVLQDLEHQDLLFFSKQFQTTSS